MEPTETEEVHPCWICLCDEPDDNDKLPVRDCSCKGDTDAGYAHISCLINYAKQQSDKVAETQSTTDITGHEFVMAWAKCTNCNQPYQHDLANKLSNALLKLIDNKYSNKSYWNQVRFIEAYQVKLNAIYTMEIPCPTKLKKDGIDAANRILSIVEDMKTNRIDIMILLGISHETFQKDIIDGNQSYAYGQLGILHMMSKGEEDQAISNYEKCLAIYKSHGDTSGISYMESMIDIIKRDYADDDDETKAENLKLRRQSYNSHTKEDTAEAIDDALHLANALVNCYYGIEAERLLTKYIVISQRVHGKEHDKTKRIESQLNKCKARLVALEDGEIYQILRYEGDNQCVVKSVMGEDTIQTTDINCIHIDNGTPIICQGLKKAAHLNGKLGDIRSFDVETERYGVHFVDTSLIKKPVAIKKENVRIVFDLPKVE